MTTLWASTKDALVLAGVSRDTFKLWRDTGLLKPGQDWRSKSTSPRSPIQYRLAALERVMAQNAVNRQRQTQLRLTAKTKNSGGAK